ncbi:MAG: hypothetical protein O6948_02315 [Deltaproteobacteria bacterium]|nr:hypothetical protein [Deltaproteobacteria bacterium]
MAAATVVVLMIVESMIPVPIVAATAVPDIVPRTLKHVAMNSA